MTKITDVRDSEGNYHRGAEIGRDPGEKGDLFVQLTSSLVSAASLGVLEPLGFGRPETVAIIDEKTGQVVTGTPRK